ncbi:MAG: hypothetical protein Q8R24_05260 [Legionellaceae bacterium]|nr:hypothetical protein [Legionellaceae bacterium]
MRKRVSHYVNNGDEKTMTGSEKTDVLGVRYDFMTFPYVGLHFC